jgi:site-specific DNA recombinase
VIQVKVALYIRVSTDEQATKGNSLVEQEERLRAYCKAMGWDEIEAFIDDGYSAKDMNRPKLQEMLDRVKKREFKMIITTKIDRLCRNLLDLLTIIDDLDSYQCGYISASESFDTSTPAGRMSLQILGAFAEFERQRIRERVRENMQSIVKKSSRTVARPCFGYDIKNGEYIINHDEAKYIHQMVEWALNGDGFYVIAKRLNDLGVKTKDGKIFSENSVRKLLQRETIAGKFVYNRTYMHKGKLLTRPEEEWIVIENHHVPILDKETFDKLQTAISVRKVSRKQADNDRWLLSGLVICGHCGAKMVGQYRKKPSGREYFNYMCSGYHKKGVCFRHYVNRDDLEQGVIQEVCKLNVVVGGKTEIYVKNEEKTSLDVKSIQDRIKKLNVKMQRQIELFEDGDISKEDFRLARDRIELERADLNKQLEAAQKDTVEHLQEEYRKSVEAVKDQLLSKDRATVKNAIRYVVKKITVMDGKKITIFG